MPPPVKLLLSFLAGWVLLWLALLVIGALAAIQTPALLRPLTQGHGWFGVTLHSLLIVHIPAALFAMVYGWVVFRLLDARGLLVVATCVLPWLTYCVVEAVNYYHEAQFPPSQKLALLLAWYMWFGRLSIPLGLWLASRLAGQRTQSAA